MALEPIDCTSHSREIEQAYLKVVRGDDADTTWLIISPNEKKEYTPAFVGSDFSSFLENFDEGKVQFGMARVSPPGSDVEKLILIGWCPDSAPMKTRASFAANFGTVANQVLKGYHVQVTARDEDDLDEKELLQKISNAAGARYSIQMNTEKTKQPIRRSKVSSPSPVPSAPKPAPEVQPAAVEPKYVATKSNNVESDDWNEPEVEERDFDKNPLKANQSTYKPIGKVDLQKVIAEENAKQDPRLVSSTEASSKIEPGADIQRLKEESKLKRDNEINNFLGTKPPKGLSAAERNDDLVIKGFKNEKSPAQLWAEKKAAAAAAPEKPPTAHDQSSSVPSKASNESEEPEENDVQDLRSKFEKLASQNESEKPAENEVKDLKSRFEKPAFENEPEELEEPEENDVKDLKSRFEKLASTSEPPIVTPRPAASKPISTEQKPASPVNKDPKKFGMPLPGMHMEVQPEDEPRGDSDDDDWDDDEPSAPTLPSRNSFKKPDFQAEEREQPISQPSEQIANTNQTEIEEELDSVPDNETQETQEAEEPPAPAPPARNNASVAPPPPARKAVEPSKPAAPSAIAEYDYEAAEDNELTFEENDKIINIDFVDDDWWLGELEKTGEKGLFPSNYVNLQE